MSLLFLLFLGSADLMAQSQSVRIQVLDEHTGDPLVAAVAHIGKKTMQTDLKGQLTLTLDAEETDGLHVHLVGYHEAFIPLKQLRATTGLHTLYLHPEERSLSSVTVVGSRSTRLVNSVSTKVSSIQLERNLGRSLASLLTDISGVTSLQTGTTTAKPVIHGMYGTRVLIVNNGVRQSGQQWGEDHAPEVSVDANDEVHVLKGAEAVSYGSEAIAGVVVLGQKPFPYGGGKLQGSLAGRFASNGRR